MSKIKKLITTLLNINEIYKSIKYTDNKSSDCVVLCNGPSLSESINNNKIPLGIDVVCVNYFALSKHYERFQPKHYFLSDPFFFEEEVKPLSKINKNNKIYNNDKFKNLIIDDYNYLSKQRKKLYESINSITTWEMILHVPIHYLHSASLKKITNKKIKFSYYSQIPSAFKQGNIRNFLYRTKIFMPLPQNILIPTLAGAVRLGYKNIYIVGADHSWHEEFVINNENILGINDKHFYDCENNTTLIFKPLINDFETAGLTDMKNQFRAQYLIFRSHGFMRGYAENMGSNIINLSDKSYIDAYERFYN